MPPILMESEPVDFSYLSTIKTCCDKLVNDTQADLKLFQVEQNSFRHKITEVVQENTQLKIKLDSHIHRLSSSSIKENHSDGASENLTRQAISILKKQVDSLKKENEDLKAFNKTTNKTIENLEQEIETYRKQFYQPNLKNKANVLNNYKTVIQTLDGAMKAQKVHFDKQSEAIDNLLEEKAKLNAKIELLDNELQEVTQQLIDAKRNNVYIEELKSQLKESNWQCGELEKSLKACRHKLDMLHERENHALNKVHEALAIAEAAEIDKSEALQREQLLKDECATMAATIGQVMEEASQKVDKDMEGLRHKYEEKDKRQKKVIEAIYENMNTQRENIEKLQTRCAHFEDAYRKVANENRRILNHLKCTIRSMEDMEEKLKTSETMVEEYKRAKRRSEDNERELQQYVNENKELIQKYKDTAVENTKQFKEQLYRMQHENATLKTELQLLRIKFGYDGEFG